MFAVHFYENRNHYLSQLRESVPMEGQELRIKGRKGKVTAVDYVDEKNVHVHVSLTKTVATTATADTSKKKKR